MAIISASDLKTWMGISDSNDDTLLTTAASAACTWVIQTCGRSFEVTNSGSETARVFQPKTQTICVTDDFSSTVNLAVKVDNGDDGTYETTLTLNTDFLVEPVNGIEDGLSVPYRKIRAKNWVFPHCHTFPSVQVTARWGWSAVPDAVKQAALIEGARIAKRSKSPEGVLGGFQDFGATPIRQKADPDALALLNPYIRAETALLA